MEPVVMKIPTGLNSCFKANKINCYFQLHCSLLHFIENTTLQDLKGFMVTNHCRPTQKLHLNQNLGHHLVHVRPTLQQFQTD